MIDSLSFVGDHIFLAQSDRERLASAGVAVSFIPGFPDPALLRAQPAAAVATWGHVDLSTAREWVGTARLKLLILMSTGFEESIEPPTVDFLRNHGVTVSCTPRYAATAVAEFAVGLALAARRRMDLAISGRASTMSALLGRNLLGATLGVLGWGAIGHEVARLAAGIGMSVELSRRSRATGIDPAVRPVPLAELFQRCDVVVLCCSLNPGTQGLVAYDLLAGMPLGAVLVNVARADVLQPRGLRQALAEREDLRVAIDADPETLLRPDWCDLADHPQVVWTPHMGFNSVEALENCSRIVVDNVIARIEGLAANEVSFETSGTAGETAESDRS